MSYCVGQNFQNIMWNNDNDQPGFTPPERETSQESQYYIGFWLERDYHVKEEFYYLDLCPDITII